MVWATNRGLALDKTNSSKQPHREVFDCNHLHEQEEDQEGNDNN